MSLKEKMASLIIRWLMPAERNDAKNLGPDVDLLTHETEEFRKFRVKFREGADGEPVPIVPVDRGYAALVAVACLLVSVASMMTASHGCTSINAVPAVISAAPRVFDQFASLRDRVYAKNVEENSR